MNTNSEYKFVTVYTTVRGVTYTGRVSAACADELHQACENGDAFILPFDHRTISLAAGSIVSVETRDAVDL